MSITSSRHGPGEDSMILIAEDHVDSRDALKALLEASGYRVAVASNGREAIELARSLHPVVAVLDMMMPELDGFEVIRRLRRDTGTQSIPIIALTAMDGARQLSLGAGADVFVPKPLSGTRLLAEIDGLAGSAAPGRPGTTGLSGE